MMMLVDVYESGKPLPHAVLFLYNLMKEREPEVNISHRKLPTMTEHLAFMMGRPYRYWYLIGSSLDTGWIGYVSATHQNEIGIVLRKEFREKGYGSAAIQLFIEKHQPLPETPSRRHGCWLANISPANERSVRLFHSAGFRLIQHTYALEEVSRAQTKT